MTDTPLISVIIPVFNAEHTLDRCLESLLGQSYSRIQIILIDDGSLDSSGEICDRYSKKDTRIDVIHQSNQGVSVARNRGIEIAEGDFIVFVDADDWVESPYLQSFLPALRKNDQLLIVQGYTKHSQWGEVIEKEFPVRDFKQEDFSDLFGDYEFIRVTPYPYAKLFSSAVIKKNALFFREEIKYGEDLIFILEYLSHVQHVIGIKGTYYHYEYMPGSLSNTLNAYQDENRRYEEVSRLIKQIEIEHVLGQKAIAYHRSYMAHYFIRTLISLFHGKQKMTLKDSLKLIDVKVKSDEWGLIHDYYFPQGKAGKLFKRLFLAKWKVSLAVFLELLFRIRKDLWLR